MCELCENTWDDAMSSHHSWLVSLSLSPPFTNISLTESWSIINHRRDNQGKSLQIGLMRRGEPYGLSAPPCPEPCHYCHVGDRCRDLTITNSIIRSVNCSHHHQAAITQHKLLPRQHQHWKESKKSRKLKESREWRIQTQILLIVVVMTITLLIRIRRILIEFNTTQF